MARSLILRSEATAWSALERALADPAYGEQFDRISVVEWKPEILYLSHEDVEHAISYETMRALSDYEAKFRRAYSVVVYGTADSRALKADDREILNTKFVVVSGSAGYLKLPKSIQKALNSALSKLTGQQVMIIVLGLLILNTTNSCAKEWLRHRAEVRNMETFATIIGDMNEAQKHQLELLQELIKQFPICIRIKEEADASREPLLRPLALQGGGRLMGNEVDQTTAEALLRPPVEEREPIQLHGYYNVIEINAEPERGWAIYVEHPEDRSTFKAYVDSFLVPHDDIGNVFWAIQNKRPIWLNINGWVRAGEVIRAEVVSAHRVGSNGT